jgi:hypothetical protein
MSLPLRAAVLCLASIAATCASAQQLSIADASITEGDSGTQAMSFTISLSAPRARATRVDVTTANGTALATSDYQSSTSLALRIPAGLTSQIFTVPVVGDTTAESEESFYVNLSNPVGATISDGQAIGTITDNDGGGDSPPALRVMDAEVNESGDPTRELQFYVVLTRASEQDVTFDLSSADGTATEGSDYAALSLSNQRIPAGQTFKLFAITVYGDTNPEMNETLSVTAGNVQGAAVADATGVMTIINDDATTINIDDASITEGNNGTKAMSFRVWLSAPTSGPIYFSVATLDGSAKAGSDYGAVDLTRQFIAVGESEKQFVVNVSGDTAVEPDETFGMKVYDVSAANLGDVEAVGTITNDDVGGGSPVLTIADVSVAEGNRLSKQMTFTVKLSAAATGPVTYNIASANGTATAGTDYVAKSLVGQAIPAGVTSKVFTVAIKGDRVVEPNETLAVNVTGVTGATVGDGQAIGTIKNDDAATLGIARFDARGLVDDIDDGNAQPKLSGHEYALMLLDSARSLCARGGDVSVFAVEAVENRSVLSDLALAVGDVCDGGRRYEAAMADGDSRGFLVDPSTARVLAAPLRVAGAAAVRLDVLPVGQTKPVSIVLVSPEPSRRGESEALADAVRQATAEERPLVLLGASAIRGAIELRPAGEPDRASTERVYVNAALMEQFGRACIGKLTSGGAAVLQLQE